MNRPGCLGKGAVDGKVALATLRLGPEPCGSLLLNIVTQSDDLTGSSWKRKEQNHTDHLAALCYFAPVHCGHLIG